MAQYTGIQGSNILIVSSDPANPVEGQIWYNSTSNLLKGYQNVIVNAAWASGGNLGTAKYMMGSAIQGTQTASLKFGGNPYTGVTESYNGTSWSPVSSLNTPRGRLAGAGTQTAALGFGGLTPLSSATESWGGSSWTTVNSLNRAVRNNAGIGTQTAAVSFGGVDNSDNVIKGMTATAKLHNLDLTPIKGELDDVIKDYTSDNFVAMNLDYCGYMAKQATSFKYVVDNDLIVKNGFLFLTFIK
jgi:hypothetical protein